ncbi:MAG: hypothetical protein II042_06770, partial [Erysipelotrichaceae bacterium]|nr:hypothetical protein [Erysipelotrichaceae bacterium]
LDLRTKLLRNFTLYTFNFTLFMKIQDIVTEAVETLRGLGLLAGVPVIEEDSPDLTQLFKEADKTCRLCFICPAADSCKWDESTKNQTVRR